jgi:hypothetical protein
MPIQAGRKAPTFALRCDPDPEVRERYGAWGEKQSKRVAGAADHPAKLLEALTRDG